MARLAYGVLQLSVVLPAHNESELLATSVGTVVEGLRARGLDFEVIVVENGSTDGTAELAFDLARTYTEVRALSMPVPDYGRALRSGFLAARGEAVVNFDVDWCDLEFLDRALPRLSEPDGPAIVVGSKRAAGSNDDRSIPRKVVTSVFSVLLRVAFGISVSDTHGVKGMRRLALLPIAERCQFGQDLFDTELILRAERAGRTTVEVPVRVVELRPPRSSLRSRIPRTLTGLARLRVALWLDRGGMDRGRLDRRR